MTWRRGLVHAFLPAARAGRRARRRSRRCCAARPELAALEADLARAESRLAEPALAADLDAMARALAHQERLLGRWAAAGGDSAEGEARLTCARWGSPRRDLRRPTRELSGGQRKLVALAACLARRPDVLLLDEPEAHLDMSRREQLEAMIRDFDGAVVMVSHDRYLLDECVAAIAELDRGRVRMWPGAYSAYTVARRLELERQQERYVAQQKEIARLEEAVRRFKHWAHIRVNERAAKQARVKQMQIDRMDKVERPVFERRRWGSRCAAAPRGGQRVVRARGRRRRVRRPARAARRRARDPPRRARRRRRPERRGQEVLLRLARRRARADRRHGVARPVDRRRLPLPGGGRASRATRR